MSWTVACQMLSLRMHHFFLVGTSLAVLNFIHLQDWMMFFTMLARRLLSWVIAIVKNWTCWPLNIGLNSQNPLQWQNCQTWSSKYPVGRRNSSISWRFWNMYIGCVYSLLYHFYTCLFMLQSLLKQWCQWEIRIAKISSKFGNRLWALSNIGDFTTES